MFKNTSTSYGSVSRSFHWLMAILVIGMICVGWYMSSLSPSDYKWTVYGLHKSFGMLVLFLIVLRTIWRFSNRTPDFPISTPRYQKIAARLTHVCLYLFMFIMPISGMLMSLFGGHDVSFFGIVTIPTSGKFEFSNLSKEMHEYGAIILAGIICLHLIAALYHHFKLKDDVMMRMIRR